MLELGLQLRAVNTQMMLSNIDKFIYWSNHNFKYTAAGIRLDGEISRL